MNSEEKERNGFVVMALTGRTLELLNRKRLPFTLYQELKAKREIRFHSWEEREDCDEFDKPAGWELSAKAEQRIREEALSIATEEQKALAEKINSEEQRKKEEKKQIISIAVQKFAIIDAATEKATRITESNYSPQGEEIQDPRHPENIYGGGHWWVVEEKRILDVENNGHDGDNWSDSNVRTGGAGAIGREVAKTDEVVEALHFIKMNASKIFRRGGDA